MIIPSIDLQGGHAVQLIGGEEKAIDAGPPEPIARKFSIAGEVAVIDLDAAMGKGSNWQTISELCQAYDCRVGGGIRDLETARYWLDKGAAKIIIGTAAKPELLSELPRERVLAALDARHGEVVVEGWTKKTGHNVLERLSELKQYVSGFLVTFVEREGRLGGTDLDFAREIVKAAAPARVTIAGGVTTGEEIQKLDAIGADAQVGMAIYSGRLHLGEAIAAVMASDRQDGLIPTMVCDERGFGLGMCFSNSQSISAAVDESRGIYWSRRRGLWRKGESSGHTQELVKITPDCDRDCLRFTVKQTPPGFCHLDEWSCFGQDWGLGRLERRLQSRLSDAPEGSYTARLFKDADLLASKVIEEATELNEAQTREEVVHEAADLIFFTISRLVKEGVSLAEIERHLGRRALKVTRRH